MWILLASSILICPVVNAVNVDLLRWPNTRTDPGVTVGHHVKERGVSFSMPPDMPGNNSHGQTNITEYTEEHCSQGSLTDGFGMIIQGILAVLAFSSLILKRLREPKEDRRSWTIWFYDTSKQALGAGVIHIANVLLSAELSPEDPCKWYIVYFLLDSTFGLFVIYISVKISQCITKLCNCKTLYFGEYGDPPACEAWVGQCGLFVLIVVLEKVAITFFARLTFWSEVAKTLLSPIHNPKVEVVIVMLLVPFILNAIMFWVVDNFLMRKRRKVKADVDNGKVRYFKLKPKVKNDSLGPELEVLLSQEEENETVVLTPRGTDETCNGRNTTRL
ncbi:store-operated calcium entry regulator STIMATE-like [Acanthaster planci]|uniref:Store-operated calcium entry regulator STIMATE-like n=1 Tax=Acanthaster planci TaxID=133434 RepID=A0A8B7ZIP8_ACAPL|nr:store-operated calcium entry regulator STIMATE-like [Acanthaster planci]